MNSSEKYTTKKWGLLYFIKNGHGFLYLQGTELYLSTDSLNYLHTVYTFHFLIDKENTYTGRLYKSETQ